MKKTILITLLSILGFSRSTLGQVNITPGKNGGTGVANVNKTITLGGSIITTGTSTPTFAFGTTNKTYKFFNATDSIASISTVQNFTNKTGNISMWTNNSGYLTSSTGLSLTLSAGKVYVGNGSNIATAVTPSLSGTPGTYTWSTTGAVTFPDAATGTRGLLNSTDWNVFNGKQAALNGTGYLYMSGTTPSYTTSIPNSSLANSTISGVSLGSNLSNHTVGYGLSGSSYNGSGAISWTADTSCASCPASKLYVTAKLGTEVTLTGTQTLTNKTLTSPTITPITTPTLAIVATTTVNGQNTQLTNISLNSSTLTAVSVTYTNIPDGGAVTLDYQKTTASNSAWTFPSGSIVSNNSDATITGGNLIATMASTTSGRYRIRIERQLTNYFVYITNLIP